MSGMSVKGQIMIQDARGGGFSAEVFPTRLDAAIQLMREMIRQAPDAYQAMEKIDVSVAEMISEERKDLDMEAEAERLLRGEEP